MSKLVTMESRKGWTIFFDGQPVYGFPGEDEVLPFYWYEAPAVRAVKRLKVVLENSGVSGKLVIEPVQLQRRTIHRRKLSSNETVKKE